MNAVITADIIDYTKLSGKEEDLVIETLYDTFEEASGIRTNINSSFIITRGDSIQIEMEHPGEALRIALVLKSVINKLTLKDGNRLKPSIDIRIAIGIGQISTKREYVNESTGDAYTYSGRTLDSMKKNKRTLAIKTHNQYINEELETEFQLLEVIMSGWYVSSAEVIHWTLLNLNENEISKKLKVSQSAINQRKKTAGWNGIKPLLERYKVLIEREF
jgi:hypothetical protein